MGLLRQNYGLELNWRRVGKTNPAEINILFAQLQNKPDDSQSQKRLTTRQLTQPPTCCFVLKF